MLSIVNSLAVVYIYKQFSSLRKAGSKYLLGESFDFPSVRYYADVASIQCMHVCVMHLFCVCRYCGTVHYLLKLCIW